MKVYTCPECGRRFQEGFLPNECTGCGCPSEYFKVTEDTNSKKYLTVCPDCGKTWDGLFPPACDNCGCPSESFVKQEVVAKTQQTSDSPEKSSTYIGFDIAVSILAVIIGGWFIYNKYLSQEKSSSLSYERRSSYTNNYSHQSKTIDNYDDIRKQVRVCEQKKQKFINEVDKITYKASMAQYQGILSQKLFWDANDALDDFNREEGKLERLLRKHGFTDMAEQCKRDREYLNQVYREEKRKVQGY